MTRRPLSLLFVAFLLGAGTAAAEPIAEEPPAAAPITQETPAAEPIAEEAPAAEPITKEAPAAEPIAKEPPAAAPITQETPAAEPIAEEPTAATAPPAEEPAAVAAPLEEEVSAVAQPREEPASTVAETVATSKDEREQADASQKTTALRPLFVFAGSTADLLATFAGEVEDHALDAVNDTGWEQLIQPTARRNAANLASALRQRVEETLSRTELADGADERAREIQRVFRLGKDRPRTRAVDEEVLRTTFFWWLNVSHASCSTRTSSELCKAGVEVDVFRLEPASGEGHKKVGSFSVAASALSTEDRNGLEIALDRLDRELRKELHDLPGLALTTPTQVSSDGDVVLNGLGDRQGVGVDDLFVLLNQRPDGSFQQAALARVHEVGEGEEPTLASLVSVSDGWKLRGGELARARPMLGLSLWVAGGAFSGILSNEPAVASASGSLGVSLGLGQATGWAGFSSELEIDGAFALGGQVPAALLAHLGLRKQWRVRRVGVGLAVAASGGLGFEVGGRAELSLDLRLAPALSLGARGGTLALWNTPGPNLSPYGRAFVAVHF